MVRTLTVVIGMAMSLVVARDASAIPITPVDLDTWVGGSPRAVAHRSCSKSPTRPCNMGEIASDVFFDGSADVHLCAHGNPLPPIDEPQSSALTSASMTFQTDS